jgi:ribA/ribD-fused uncharacterized protein
MINTGASNYSPVLFFGTDAKKNECPFLSNFYKSPIMDPEQPQIIYTCVEQFFQHKKALFALDFETAEKILATNNPVRQKQLGRKAVFSTNNVGHTLYDWNNGESERVMFEAVKCKFEQNIDLRRLLLATETRPIGECNPRDKLWGIGLGRNNPDAQQVCRWIGKNKLGCILMNVRTFLQNKNESLERFDAE